MDSLLKFLGSKKVVLILNKTADNLMDLKSISWALKALMDMFSSQSDMKHHCILYICNLLLSPAPAAYL